MTVPHPRPNERTLAVRRISVEGYCANCGEAGLQAYPVLSEGGWFEVVKCSNCLHSASRKPGPKLGPIELLSDQV